MGHYNGYSQNGTGQAPWNLNLPEFKQAGPHDMHNFPSNFKKLEPKANITAGNKTTKDFGANTFNMMGQGTNPDAVDPEKEKDFYPIKTLTVHTTKFVVNHGRWICGIELAFWDTEVQEKYSDLGVAEYEQAFGCGDDYGGITSTYEFERGE
jgi:hypothetical protein